MLEYFVHLDQGDPPADLVLATADVPEELARERIPAEDLPSNWRDPAAPPELSKFGDEFAQRGENCLLLVPSALAPGEHNYLINPAHPDFKRIAVGELAPLTYDPRMFKRTRRGGHGRSQAALRQNVAIR